MARTQTPNHPQSRVLLASLPGVCCWAEARIKIARMTLTIKLDGNWSSFQLANNTPPLSVTGSVIAPSARIERASMGRRVAVAELGSPWLSRGHSARPQACKKKSMMTNGTHIL